MIKNKIENFKNALVKAEKKDSKKTIENLVVLAILCIITIIAINYIWKGDKKNQKSQVISNNKVASTNTIDQDNNYNSNELEQKLKKILSNISGVGDVDVLITYSQTSTVNPIYNEDTGESITEEEDTNGGKRTISSSNNKREVVVSNNEIITQSITSPQIQGAVIIAKGAGDINVKTNIIQAVEAATGLSTYKIQVFEMN